MGEFFKGWRRKAGLVTLAMAVVLMVGWMRSYVFHDELLLFFRMSYYELVSDQGQFCCECRTGLEYPTDIRWESFEIRGSGIDDLDDHLNRFETSQWNFMGFRFAKGRAPLAVSQLGTVLIEGPFHFLVIPYWSLVLPLTLLSAWLILVKPRKAKAATDSTP